MDGEKEDLSRYPLEILLTMKRFHRQQQKSLSRMTPVRIRKLILNVEMKKEEDEYASAETENLAVEDNLPMPSEAGEEDGGGSKERVMDNEELSPEENSTMQPVAEEKEKENDKEDNNLQMQPVEEEEEEQDDDDDGEDDVYDDKHGNDDSSGDVAVKEDESSEGTGCSSRESNVEAIWPTDMIEILSQELKVMNANNQNSVDKIAKTECDYSSRKSEYKSKNETIENAPILTKKIPRESVMGKVETIHFKTQEVCVWLLLALILLLLLLLHIHSTSWIRELSYDNSVIGPQVY